MTAEGSKKGEDEVDVDVDVDVNSLGGRGGGVKVEREHYRGKAKTRRVKGWGSRRVQMLPYVENGIMGSICSNEDRYDKCLGRWAN